MTAAVAAEYSFIVDKCEYPFGWGEPNDVANMICFLLSDKAKFISGQNYVIHSNGGGGGIMIKKVFVVGGDGFARDEMIGKYVAIFSKGGVINGANFYNRLYSIS